MIHLFFCSNQLIDNADREGDATEVYAGVTILVKVEQKRVEKVFIVFVTFYFGYFGARVKMGRKEGHSYYCTRVCVL